MDGVKSEQQRSKSSNIGILNRYALLLAIAWTAAVILSIAWNWFHELQGAAESAKVAGQAQYAKDVIYRRWNAGHGGVYVPVSENAAPNPYLSHLPQRDVTTIDGTQLTLINPAYMTCQVHEIGWETDQIRGHITSLNPIRPENEPDAWEHGALALFEQGQHEHSEITVIDGVEYMRYMGALVTEEGCLKCHAEQGYKVSDIRGGISVSIPMDSYQAIANHNILTLGFSHLVLWILGLAGLATGLFSMRTQVAKLQDVEAALLESAARTAELEGIHNTVGTLAHEINNPLTGIVANVQLAREATVDNQLCQETLSEALTAALRIRDAVSKLGALESAPRRPYLGDREIIDIRDEK